MEVNNMNPDQTALLWRELSDLDPYGLQYRLSKYTADERADGICLEWQEKIKKKIETFQPLS